LANSADAKRKRGRPNKQTKPEACEAKAPNYKKINNPEGTTSLLALNTPPTNIEYAGLTRFEIPFETEEETSLVETKEHQKTTSPTKKLKAETPNSHENENHNENDNISIENIQKSIMEFTDANAVQTTTSDGRIEVEQKEILENLYETTAAVAASINTNNSFSETSEQGVVNEWQNKTAEQHDNIEKKELPKKSHFSLGDLENDPIVNKDLQQLHSCTPVNKETNTSHYITNITNTNSHIITPPATVCSSVSSNASYNNNNTTNTHQQGSSHIPVNASLSINPSSTSSTSSSQMISPVSIDNARSASVDHQQQPQQKQNHHYNL